MILVEGDGMTIRILVLLLFFLFNYSLCGLYTFTTFTTFTITTTIAITNRCRHSLNMHSISVKIVMN